MSVVVNSAEAVEHEKEKEKKGRVGDKEGLFRLKHVNKRGVRHCGCILGSESRNFHC